MRSLKETSLCPSRYCQAHDPAQSLVSKRQAALVDEPALEGAILCSKCGCVWVRDQMDRRRILGTLRLDGRTYKWISDYQQAAQ